MTTQVKLTKRQREVADLLRNGWSLYIQASHARNGKPRAFVVPSGQRFILLHRPEESWITGGYKEVSWTVINALEKAHIVRPVRRATEDERFYIYALAE